MLDGEIALRVKELVRQTCEHFEILILRGVVSKDHIHILVSAPANISPSDIMRRVNYCIDTLKLISLKQRCFVGNYININ